MSIQVNESARQAAVALPRAEAEAFHRSLEGYAPTPVRDLPAIAEELGLASVSLKDESLRLGLPAFKILGASWAIERALREQPGIDTLVAASAGNHGRAVARVAAVRGLCCRVFLPARAAPARRAAIAEEGAEVVIVAGTYEEAVAAASAAGAEPGGLEIADVGVSGPAHWVIDGYATLFSEAARQASFDLIVVPVGVGSLAAAAAACGALVGARVVGVEPETAACLAASLKRGEPTAVANPGTSMAGLDCAELSAAAWPYLRDGVHGTVTVGDHEAQDAMRELAAAGFAIGDCGAAPLAALRVLALAPEAATLREAVGFTLATRVLLIATEGPTDPVAYHQIVG